MTTFSRFIAPIGLLGLGLVLYGRTAWATCNGGSPTNTSSNLTDTCSVGNVSGSSATFSGDGRRYVQVVVSTNDCSEGNITGITSGLNSSGQVPTNCTTSAGEDNSTDSPDSSNDWCSTITHFEVTRECN